MLNLKYHPGGMALNGPAFEAFAALVKFGTHEVLVVAPTAEIAEGIGAFLSDRASRAAHVLVGQPPWYQNQTKDNTLQDLLPTIEPSARVRLTPQREEPRQRGFFDDEN